MSVNDIKISKNMETSTYINIPSINSSIKQKYSAFHELLNHQNLDNLHNLNDNKISLLKSITEMFNKSIFSFDIIQNEVFP